jgi:hypothetical protein
MANRNNYQTLRNDSYLAEDDNESVSSFDIIPYPHNLVASLNGPPLHWEARAAWIHQQNVQAAAAAAAAESRRPQAPTCPPAQGSNLNPAAAEFTPRSNQPPTHQHAAPSHGYTTPYAHVGSPSEITTSTDELTRQQIRALLNPPGNMYDPPGRVTVDLPFIMRTLPAGYMVHDRTRNRVVLRRDTELYTRGYQLGLPLTYLQWLAGDDARGRNIHTLSRASILQAQRRVG